MERCVELYKSGNGDKKIATPWKKPISTIRAIVKKFKAIGNVTTLPGREPMFIFPQRKEDDKRGKKNSQGSQFEDYRG